MKVKKITEKDNRDVIDGWYEKARKMTAKGLPGFIKELTTKYQHDYGTICHACAAAGIAAASAVNSDPKQGGITGFQAGAVMWEFMQHWLVELKDKPMRLVQYEHMLYPQYKQDFNRTISQETWKWLQKQAKAELAKHDMVHPSVKAHWESIVEGKVPFGFVVAEGTTK